MRVVFFGTPTFAVPTLERLLHHPDFTVAGIVTQPDKRRGRGSQMTPSAVKQVALAQDLPLWQPTRIKKDLEVLAQLQQTQADAFVVIAYGQILSQQILDIPKLGCINVHGSILPRYRGAAPIQWSLYHGDRETGITTMLMNAGMDTGDMLLKSQLPITILENAQDIAAKLAQQGADLLIQTLVALAKGELTPIPQDERQATYAPLIQKNDFEMDWSRSAIAIHNQVRGFYPNAQTIWETRSLKVLATLPIDAIAAPDWSEELPEDLTSEFKPLLTQWLTQGQNLANPNAKPGEIIGILKNWGAIVQTGQGGLWLREVQLAGKRSQSGWDFVNGNRLAVGSRLGIDLAH
jgi:methionyl-tRNA formyltransferase